MRLKVDISGERIIVRGSRGKLLAFKNAIRKAIPASDIYQMSLDSISIHKRRLRTLVSFLDDIGFRDDGNTVELISGQTNAQLAARDTIRDILEESRSVTGVTYWDERLLPHQGVVVNALLTKGLSGLCIFDEQGTGKTLSALSAFDILYETGSVKAAIIVGPKTLLGNWMSEIDKFLPAKYEVVTVEGSVEDKYRALQRKADIYLINYEAVEPLLIPLSTVAEALPTMLVVDESFFVKNPDAARTTAVRQLRSTCKMAVVLCGTPAPNRPEDIISQFNVADDGITFHDFRLPSDPDTQVAAITNQIAERGVYIRRTKNDVLSGLPDKSFTILKVLLAPRQKQLYSKAKNELALYLRTLDNKSFKRNLTTYFQKRAALLQLCVSPSLIDPGYDETPGKYVELDQIVTRIVEEEKRKIVLWSVYTRSLDELQKRYERYGVVRVDGTVTSGDIRSRLVEDFQSDDRVRIFIGNPAAAGAGINLHAASDCVYVSYSNQAAHYFQSLDRIHRYGQSADQVNYYLLVCSDTIEEAEIARLASKETAQSALLGDPKTEGLTLESALREIGVVE